MASVAVHPKLLPHVSAELTGSFLHPRGDICTSATVTVEFDHIHATNVVNGEAAAAVAEVGIVHDDKNRDPALLLTLSPLHMIREVRVLLAKADGETINNAGEWCQLQLNSTTLCETRRHIVRIDNQAVLSSPPSSSPSPSSSMALDVQHVAPFGTVDMKKLEECVKQEAEKEEGEELNDAECEDDVLELVLGPSADYDDNEELGAPLGATADPPDPAEVRGEEGDEGEGEDYDDDGYNDGEGKQFMLTLIPSAAEGERESEDGCVLLIMRCCIDVVLLPLSELADISYPCMTMASEMGRHNASQEVCVPGDDSYVLLAGQGFYNYFICPRVAYAESAADAICFTALDVQVTAVCAASADTATEWEVLPLNALPTRPEDLLCAFVRPRRGDTESLGMEMHAGVQWRVEHHPAYTHLFTDGCEESSGVTNLYFFHCDHTLCGCLLPLTRAAHSAWEGASTTTAEGGVCSKVAKCTGETTWVVSNCSSTLLSLRRGALCMRGAVLLAATVLRTIRTQTSTPVIFRADALRAKATVLSAALEMKWRVAADRGLAPDFDTAPSSSALARAWGLCLLCDELGWTELLRQERQLASWSPPSSATTDPWCLAQRYVQEVHETLVFLSSAFAVASLRRQCCFPWQLLKKEPHETSSVSLGETIVSVSSGMHLDLVRLFLLRRRRWRQQQQQQQEQLDVAFPPMLFIGSLFYEEKQQDTARREILLHLRPPKTEATRRLLGNSRQVSERVWDIYVPFTMVCFAVEGAGTTPAAVVAVRGEQQRLPQCRVTHVLPCSWRVSGIAWARGVEQRTSFSFLGAAQDYNEGEGNSKMKNADGYAAAAAGDDEGDGNETMRKNKGISVQMQLLVLNPKVVPAALSLWVLHTEFWAKMLPPSEYLARRAVLRHIMDHAVQEGEEHVAEAELLFTPLLNQLLESLLDASSQPSSSAAEAPPLTVFLSELQSVGVGAAAVWRRIHPDAHARFARLAAKLPQCVSLAASVTLQRQDGDNKDGVCRMNIDATGATVKMQQHLRVLETYHASLPRVEPRRRQHQQSRLVLSLRRGRVGSQAMEKGKEKDKNAPLTPADVASMVSRAITGSTESQKDEVAAATARTAALSLALPLWPLLHTCPGLPEGRRKRTLEAAQDIYESLRGDVGHVGGKADTLLVKSYECFNAGR
ncbi:hypothetical protein DQ04_04591040 [Trypanosoma grayi]|uniref:hypothetical protein n=1 Tax=Trypanosoma grayi TaxID=71804 RepID=UPI0004F4AF74|nr:hypothetical protein DQ04_04591040 [Trypanosoma grayi]KEG09815.1 hypothetical protein DQ04_04591040 [Trypanosoma grayi]